MTLVQVAKSLLVVLLKTGFVVLIAFFQFVHFMLWSSCRFD